MIPRYTTPEMKKNWSRENTFCLWLDVELAAMEAMEEYGIIPRGQAAALRKKVEKLDPDRIEEIEATTRHDVIAFLMHVEEMAGEAARFLHFGMTSSDVLDTAFAIQLRDAAGLILEELGVLKAELREQACKHKTTPVVGRTHGIHAQPISLGLVFALWYAEAERNEERLQLAREEISVGKLSGAVGTYLHLSPAVEEMAMKLLGLKPEPVSNQIVQRDRHASFFCTLALCGASLEKIALNVRHWQRTEVSEAFEAFGAGQKGSSAMPHKRNPILSENICGLARLLRSYAVAALENVALWHERDISHSSVERVIGPDATTVLHFMLRRTASLIRGLEIHPEKMHQNLDLTGGLVFSESVMNQLIRSGLARQEAYKLVQRAALAAAGGEGSFKDLLLSDAEVVKLIGKEKVLDSFDIKASLRYVDAIYKRIFPWE